MAGFSNSCLVLHKVQHCLGVVLLFDSSTNESFVDEYGAETRHRHPVIILSVFITYEINLIEALAYIFVNDFLTITNSILKLSSLERNKK